MMRMLSLADLTERVTWRATPFPWIANPYRLLSLRDMLQIYPEVLTSMAHWMATLEAFCGGATDMSVSNLGRLQGDIGSCLKHIESICARIQMKAALAKAQEIRSKRRSYSDKQLEWEIGELRKRVDLELDERLFMFVPPHRTKYFDDKLFGDRVEKRFPKIVEDISEAGKCIGAGRFTAAIFHLMRVMEYGVTWIAKKLNATINTDRPWGNILKEIDAAVKAMPGSKASDPAPAKARCEKFSEMASYLHHVKVAWRNTTMHPKRTYTEEEAERIFQNVKAFMQGLAAIC
jgi:hypothetical protein